MARPRVLLTGFGPFPGFTENPSAWLAETLAERATSLGLDCELHAAVLPTEWQAVAAFAPRLYETLQPRVMIHFGLSERARSLRIERSAYNRALPCADALGKLPASPVILAERPDRLDTPLPAAALTAGLRARGHTAETSRSAGRYLCNFLYYLSLEWAARQESPPLALFMHVPPGPAQGGSFSEAALLRGAQETLRLVLAFASQRDAATPIADRTDPGFALSEARLNAKEA
jgi:pyroglutamyl-peptidase